MPRTVSKWQPSSSRSLNGLWVMIFRVGGYYSFLFPAPSPSCVRAVSIYICALDFLLLVPVRLSLSLLLSSCPLTGFYRILSSTSFGKPRWEAFSKTHTANPGRPLLLPSTSKQHLKFWHFREDGSSPLYCARTFLPDARTRVLPADSFGFRRPLLQSLASFSFSLLKFFFAEHSFPASCFARDAPRLS